MPAERNDKGALNVEDQCRFDQRSSCKSIFALLHRCTAGRFEHGDLLFQSIERKSLLADLLSRVCRDQGLAKLEAQLA
jgi:hypothetical protein